MAVNFEGFFINLESCKERRESLLKHLQAQGFSLEAYSRFAAIAPSDPREHERFGLSSRGELGIWRTTIALMRAIDSVPGPPVVHCMEDDARFCAAAPGVIKSLVGLMRPTQSNLPPLDLIFLDSFLDVSRLEALLERLPQEQKTSVEPLTAVVEFLPAHAYLASLTSFLVARSSAGLIAELLSRAMQNLRPLPPVDLALRGLLRAGALRALICMPPLGAPSWESGFVSTIQSAANQSRQRSQVAHILMRQFASGLMAPKACTHAWAELFSLPQEDGFAMPSRADFVNLVQQHVSALEQF